MMTWFFFWLAMAGAEPHLISVGQGYAAPSSVNSLFFSGGYAYQNPAGLTNQKGLRATGLMDQNGSTGYGAELGYGTGTWGLAVGAYDRDCDDCESDAVGGLALNVGSFLGFGMRFEEEVYGVGLLFNRSGTIRLGLSAQLNDPDGDDNNITSLGAGLGWFSQQWAFVVDASTNTYENEILDDADDFVALTPGLILAVDIIQVSLNYRTFLNDDDDLMDDEFWFGVGIGGSQFHLAFYSDYVNDVALSLSAFF